MALSLKINWIDGNIWNWIPNTVDLKQPRSISSIKQERATPLYLVVKIVQIFLLFIFGTFSMDYSSF